MSIFKKDLKILRGLLWNGFYCPSCRRRTIVHSIKPYQDSNVNIDNEIIPEDLVDKFDTERSQYCMNCGWHGIITDF